MKKIYHRLQQALGFSQRETNGFLIISLLMLLAITGMFWIPVLFPAAQYDPTADRHQLDSLVALLDTSSYDSATGYLYKDQRPTLPLPLKSLVPFNPNQISTQQWQELGLPRFLAERILKYRTKGGRFRVKSDLKKIYSFPEPLYQQLYPYIQLPESLANRNTSLATPKTSTSFQPYEFKERVISKPTRFNLNTADTNQLKAIRGIGSSLSRRILNYRDALGGFVSTQQIREVYGLDSLVVDELLKYGYLPDSQPSYKLKINSATVEELDAHPYVTPKLAKIIVAYRQQHGPYQSTTDLANIKILDSATLQKIAPYLSFE